METSKTTLNSTAKKKHTKPHPDLKKESEGTLLGGHWGTTNPEDKLKAKQFVTKPTLGVLICQTFFSI